MRTRGFFSRIAASDRPHWNRTSKRRSSRPSSRPSAARCDTHTENTRARRRRTANGWLGSSSASISSPTRSSATLRSARTASSATGSQASSGMTCGTSGAAALRRLRSTLRTRSRLRDCSARISIDLGVADRQRVLDASSIVGAVAGEAGGERRAQRAQHRGAGRDVFDVGQSSSTARLSRLRSSVWM